MQPMASMALRAARNAGRIIARAVDRIDVIKVEEKQKNDLVSDIDRAAEAAIIEELHKTYPGHSIIGEESGKAIDGDEDYTWIIDPLDGTTNFLHGIPHFAVSIGCVHRGRLEHAVVLDPLRDESFVASRGHGAQLNEKRIRVTRRDRLDGAVVGTGIPFRQNDVHLEAYMRQLTAVARAGPRHSPCRLGCARPGLRRCGPSRCVLGNRPEALGPGGGRTAGHRSGRSRLGLRRRRRLHGNGQRRLRQSEVLQSPPADHRTPRHAGDASKETGLSGTAPAIAGAAKALDDRVLIRAFRLGQDQILTIDLERDEHVCRYVDRRIGTHDHPDHERLREALDHLAAEQKQGDEHEERRQRGDERWRPKVWLSEVLITSRPALAQAPEVLPDPV